MSRVIFLNVELDDFNLAGRAVRYLMARPEKDAILSYASDKDFYVRRNKSSITVRPVTRFLPPATPDGQKT